MKKKFLFKLTAWLTIPLLLANSAIVIMSTIIALGHGDLFMRFITNQLNTPLILIISAIGLFATGIVTTAAIVCGDYYDKIDKLDEETQKADQAEQHYIELIREYSTRPQK